MKLSTLAQRTLKLLLYGSSFAGVGVVFNVVQLASLLLLPVSRRLVSAVNARICGAVWRAVNYAFEAIDIPIAQPALIGCNAQNARQIDCALVICNHLSFIDWSLINALAIRKGMIDHCKYFVKYSMRFFPFFGIGMYLAGFPFLRRNWAADSQTIEKIFHHLKNDKLPCWLISFVEGTRLTPYKLHESQTFCAVRGLPHLSNVMYPRKRGLFATICAFRHSHVRYVYDLTIAYFHEPTQTMNRHFPTLIDIHSNEQLQNDWRFHIHLDRILLDDIPINELEFGHWLKQRWIIKDELLEKWKTTWPIPGEDGCYVLPYYS